MKSRRVVGVGILMVLALFQGVALAKDDEATARAKALFTEGTTQYNLARFEDALAAFQQAYLAKAEPGLLINVGQCYRMLGDHKKAVYAYRRFLDSAPRDHRMRPGIEELVASEEAVLKKIGEKPAPSAPVPVPIAPPEVIAKPAPPPPPIIAPIAPAAAPIALSPRALPTVNSEVAPKAATKPTPIYKKWWLWTIVGGVIAVGAGVGIGVAYALPNDASPPSNAALALPVHF